MYSLLQNVISISINLAAVKLFSKTQVIKYNQNHDKYLKRLTLRLDVAGWTCIVSFCHSWGCLSWIQIFGNHTWRECDKIKVSLNKRENVTFRVGSIKGKLCVEM